MKSRVLKYGMLGIESRNPHEKRRSPSENIF